MRIVVNRCVRAWDCLRRFFFFFQRFLKMKGEVAFGISSRKSYLGTGDKPHLSTLVLGNRSVSSAC